MSKKTEKAEEGYFDSKEEKAAAMEGYDALFAAAEAKGAARDISFEIVKWENLGQTLTGEITGFEEFSEGEFETHCNKWLIQTDKGQISCVMGSAADKNMKDAAVGDLVKIVYNGKREISGGRQVNLFSIKLVKME